MDDQPAPATGQLPLPQICVALFDTWFARLQEQIAALAPETERLVRVATATLPDEPRERIQGLLMEILKNAGDAAVAQAATQLTATLEAFRPAPPEGATPTVPVPPYEQ